MPPFLAEQIVKIALSFYPQASDRSIVMFTKDVEYLMDSAYFTSSHVAQAAYRQWGNKNAAQDMLIHLELEIPAFA